MQIFEKIIEKLQECERQAEKDMGLSEKYAEANAYGGEMIAFEKAIEIVKQEAAECNNGWIPVEERLPEESLNSVIGWDEYRKRCCFVQYLEGRWILGNDIDSVKIIAWKPLPEPYQKGE